MGARVAEPGAPTPATSSGRFYADWTERDWGEITNQDYANMAEVQTG